MISRFEKLLAELKRRHVFRMAGLYAVGAWLVIQVAATTFPYLGLPQWTITAAIVIAVLGLPLAIALAWAFDLTAEGIRRDAESTRSGALRLVVPVLAGIAVIAGGFIAVRRVASSNALDANLTAVLPFQVTGGDARMAELSEGMVDLLAMRLSGERGIRAADARGAISAWRRAGGDQAPDPNKAARAAARAVGAGRMITGSVVVTGHNVSIAAKLSGVAGGGSARDGSVSGPVDSLLALVDNLAVALLAQDAGLETQRLVGLTSVPALQAFLAGKAAHRRGNYVEAMRSYGDALKADSTFALAAVSLAISSKRVPNGGEQGVPAIAIAHRHRNKLSPRDQAMLHALGPAYPMTASILQEVTAFEDMLAKWPEDADGWFELGDLLLHYGRASDIENSLERAEQALQRALAIDSTFSLPVDHLLLAAFERQDADRVRALAPQRARVLGADALRADYFNWRIALTLGDSAALNALAARFDSISPLSLNLIRGDAQWQGARLEDAERIGSLYAQRAVTDGERRRALQREHDLALNRGMVRRAKDVLDRTPVTEANRALRDLQYVQDALFWDGDAEAAQAAAARLQTSVLTPATTPAASELRARLQCELAWWSLANGRTADAAARLKPLRMYRPGVEASDFSGDDRDYCIALLEAWSAVDRKAANASQLIQRADSINIASSTTYWLVGNLITARLKDRNGDGAGALRSIRRTFVGGPDQRQLYASTFLRETARLAAAQNDTALARDHYRRYVALRANADPALQPDLERARAELAQITAEPRR